MPRAAAISLVLLFACPWVAEAQSVAGGETGPRPLLPREHEIALARSAAPASVSSDATVYVLTAAGYERAAEGRNGVACYVSRDWKTSLEPHCFDREGAETIMRMAMRRIDLLHGGISMKEADRVIADGLLSGEFRLPRRPAMSWMMSSSQELVSPDGRPVGAWRPHIMIYYPFLTAEDVGLAAQASGPPSAVLVDGGSPFANLMVIVPDFAEPVAAVPVDRGSP